MSKDVFRTTFSGPPPANATPISCPGCQASFDCVKITRGDQEEESTNYSIDYFLHVIAYCDEYKKLDLITKCKHCKCLFVDSDALLNHKPKCPYKKKRPIKRYYDFN